MDPTNSDQLPPSPDPSSASPIAGGSVPVADEVAPAPPVPDSDAVPPGPPRAWPAIIGALLINIGGGVIGSLLAIIVAVLGLVMGAPAGGVRKGIVRAVHEPWFAALNVALASLVMILLVMLVVHASRRPWRERLGLGSGRVPARELPWLVLGAIGALGVGAVAMLALHRIGLLPDACKADRMDVALAGGTLAAKIALVLCGSVVVGVAEELNTRGYLQRALLRRWRPGPAIAVTAVIFALLHGAPAQIVYVLPISFFLGYVAWRADSILPGMVCHMSVNAVGLTLAAVFGARLLQVGPGGSFIRLGPFGTAWGLIAAFVVGALLAWLAVWRVERVVRAGGRGEGSAATAAPASVG
jgi:membrane protease YdiL (CAAX protease family)